MSRTHQLGATAFGSLLAACSGPCSDQWRLQLLQILHNACTVSAAQAAALLQCFETRDILAPVKILLMSMHDVPNLAAFERAVADYSEAYEHNVLLNAYEQLGCPPAVLVAHNPSGHYHLDLTNQVSTNLFGVHACCRGSRRGVGGHSHTVAIHCDAKVSKTIRLHA